VSVSPAGSCQWLCGRLYGIFDVKLLLLVGLSFRIRGWRQNEPTRTRRRAVLTRLKTRFTREASTMFLFRISTLRVGARRSRTVEVEC